MTRYVVVGIVVMVFGMTLRFNAHDLAWPQSYGYSGPREGTEWAIREGAINDIGMGLFHVGGMLLVGICLIPFLCGADRAARTSNNGSPSQPTAASSEATRDAASSVHQD